MTKEAATSVTEEDQITTVEIPQEWVQGLEWDQAELLHEVVQLGIR